MNKRSRLRNTETLRSRTEKLDAFADLTEHARSAFAEELAALEAKADKQADISRGRQTWRRLVCFRFCRLFSRCKHG